MTTLVSKPNFGKDPDVNDDGVFGALDDRTLSYTPFAFTGEIDIEVTKLYGTAASRVEISPKAFGIERRFGHPHADVRPRHERSIAEYRRALMEHARRRQIENGLKKSLFGKVDYLHALWRQHAAGRHPHIGDRLRSNQ